MKNYEGATKRGSLQWQDISSFLIYIKALLLLFAGAELPFVIGVGERRWICAQSIEISVIYCFLKAKTPVCNTQDPRCYFDLASALAFCNISKWKGNLFSRMIYGGLLSKSTYAELYSFARYMKFSLKKNQIKLSIFTFYRILNTNHRRTPNSNYQQIKQITTNSLQEITSAPTAYIWKMVLDFQNVHASLDTSLSTLAQGQGNTTELLRGTRNRVIIYVSLPTTFLIVKLNCLGSKTDLSQ